MEGSYSGGSLQLVSELSRVQELVRKLELQLHAPASSSVELCRQLAAQIIALTDRSIGIVAARFPDTPTPPVSGTPSPLSDVSDQPFRTKTNKRKEKAKWTSQVRVSAAGGAEGPADDGHSWRKYGQKDILGAKHPRGYYRCTHRNSQGCMATKQVQRTDEDPTVFDVVYHGEHTCRPAAAKRPPQHQQHNPHAQSLLQSLSAGLTVNTDSSLNATAAPPLTPENRSARGVSPSLLSPVASDSKAGLAMSPCPVIGYREWQTSDGDLQEVVSALAAVSAAPAPMPTVDAELMQYCFDFDPSFDIDAPSLFQLGTEDQVQGWPPVHDRREDRNASS